LNTENDRYSFACAWSESDASGSPDLYVANDFGRSNLYRNNGDGTFTAISGGAHVEDAGAGMSACWSDFDNGGKQDIYAANMWSAAGQRVSTQKIFHQSSSKDIQALYRRHARGNSLYSSAESSMLALRSARTPRGSLLCDTDHARDADQDRDCGKLVPKKAASSGIRPRPRLVPIIHDWTDLTPVRILLGVLQAYPTSGKRLHVCWCRLP
jgi:hypothetical protein